MKERIQTNVYCGTVLPDFQLSPYKIEEVLCIVFKDTEKEKEKGNGRYPQNHLI